MNKVRKERKTNGLCEYCGKELNRVRKKVAEGNCVTCGNTLDQEGWFCLACVNKLKLRAQVRSAERRNNGLCVQCGEIRDVGSQCRVYLDKLKARRNGKQIMKNT